MWTRATFPEPSNPVAALILRMNSAARQVCLPAGGDLLDGYDGVAFTLDILENYFGPEAVDSKL